MGVRLVAVVVALAAAPGRAQQHAWSSAAPAGSFRGGDGHGLLVLSVGDDNTAKLWLVHGYADGGASWLEVDAGMGGLTVGGPSAVAGQCDVDGDGVDDALTLVPGQGGTADYVSVYSGATSVQTDIHAPNHEPLGGGLACVPDFHGDGRTWVLAGAHSRGAVFAFSMDQSGQFLEFGTGCGVSVDGLPLPDGGGLIVAGCPATNGASSSIMTLEVPGGAPTRVPPPFAMDGFGASLAFVGDLDGDGYQDLAVSDLGAEGNTQFEFYAVGSDGGTELNRIFEHTRTGQYRVGRLGDFNGDGYADLLLVPVDERSPPMLAATYKNSTLETLLWGGGQDSTLAAGLGDVDGDGLADFVSVSMADAGVTFKPGIARGPSDVGTPLGQVDAVLSSIAAGVDVDGDGRPDVVLGMGGVGQVAVVDGGAPIGGPSGDFGWVVAAAGDVNGDGYGDVLASAPSQGAGAVYVLYGGSGGLSQPVQLPTPDFGASAPSGFGLGLAGVGDVDGDGFDDVVVAAPASNSGEARPLAWLYPGGPSMGAPIPVGGARAFAPGSLVSRAGDFDGDGFADIAVAVPGVAPDNGFVAVYGFDPITCGFSRLFHDDVQALDIRLGGAADLDGDGVADVAVSWGNMPYGYLRGGADASGRRVVPGFFAGSLPEAMAVVGDVDGDGRPEVGAAAVVSALPGLAVALATLGGNSIIREYVATCRFVGESALIAAAGDIDGDGFADFVSTGVGAKNVCLHLGGDGEGGPGRGWGLRQRFDGQARGRGFRAPLHAQVSIAGEPRDEVAGSRPLSLEVEVRALPAAFNGQPTHVSGPGERTVSLAGLSPGRYRWRARVRSGQRVSRWRTLGWPDDGTADFSLGLAASGSDGGVAGDDGGTAESDGGAAEDGGGLTGADGGSSDGGLHRPVDFVARACGCHGAPIDGLTLLALALALVALRRRRRSLVRSQLE